MNLTHDQTLRQTLSGAVWLVLGLLAVILSLAIKKPGFANNQDPGPQFFPILLGVLMAAGGLTLLVKGLYAKWNRKSVLPAPDAKPHLNRSRVLLLFIGGFGAYLFLIPWLGFTLSSTLYGFLLLWIQGSRWYVSLAMILILMTGTKLLFGTLFHVQLPEGVIGLPF